MYKFALKSLVSNLSIFLLIFFVSACEDVKNDIPDIPVNFTIYLDDPIYRELRTVGNSITVLGGHAGIVVYRFTQDEFIAYDRLCPVEQKEDCRIQATDDDLFYTCNCCKTPYLMIDGTGQSRNDTTFPGTGKFLKAYRTYYNGNNEVRITN